MQKPFYIFSNHIIFQIHQISRHFFQKCRLLSCMRDHRHLKTGFVYLRHSQADSIYTDRSFFHDQMQDLWRCSDRYPDRILFPDHRTDHTGSIDMTTDDMTTESAISRHCTFQIDPASRPAVPKAASADRLCHHIRRESIRLK